jgi:Sulfotransferase family
MLRARRRTAAPEAEVPLWERLGELEEYRELCRVRLEHVVPVREPLVLVSQIQRSGGTLLSQLLDGHPECHADPYELKFGYPRQANWPPLDLARPDSWFDVLHDPTVGERLRPTERTKSPTGGRGAFPFLLLPRLQQTIFEARAESEGPPKGERDLLDWYFTAYFNAWLDNQNLYTGPKRVVTGFVPRLAMEPESLERYFAAYPDGTLISIVRDPRAWYVSAARHFPKHYADLEVGIGLWRRSTEAAIGARAAHGDRVLLVTYERLVAETEAVMAAIAQRVGISMLPILLEPTFNGRPIRANSSEPVDRYGVLPERADAYRDSLAGETVERIEELAGDLYERAAGLAALPA